MGAVAATQSLPHAAMQRLGGRSRQLALAGMVIVGVAVVVVTVLTRLLSLGSWSADFGLALQRAVLACLFGSGALVMCVQAFATRDSLPLPLLGMSTAGFTLSISGLFISLAVESNPGLHLAEATETGLWLDLDGAAVILMGVVLSAMHRRRPLAAPLAAVMATMATAVASAALLFGVSWLIARSPVLDLVGPGDALTRVWRTVCLALGLSGALVAGGGVLVQHARPTVRPWSMVAAAALTACACFALAGARSIPGTGWHLGHGLLIGAAGAYFVGQLRVLGSAMHREILRIRELTLLQAAARDLSATLDLDSLRRCLVRHATEILSIHDSAPDSVRLVRVNGGRCAVLAEAGAGARSRGRTIADLAGHPVLTEAIRSQTTVSLERDVFVPPSWLRTGAAETGAGVAPVVVNGEVGGLLIASYRGRQPLPQELQTLTALADLAAVAFATAWSFRGETGMVARLRTLAARSADIVSAAGVDATLLRVLSAACELTASRSAEIAVLSADGLHLDRHVAWTSGSRSRPRLVLDPPVTSADPVPMPQRAPFRLGDMPRGGEPLVAACRGSGIPSLAGVPLLYQDSTLGTLYVTDKHDELEPDYVVSDYDDRDMVILTALAIEAAVAIANARMVRRLEDAALLDPLTRLPNRRAWDRVREERPAEAYCVLAIDVDNLRIINDEGGHESGDAVLRTVADALRSSVRAGDFVARTGGDEFAVVVYGGSVAMTDALSRRIQRFLYGSPVPHGHARISVGAAHGVAHAPVADTWQAADVTLVRSKAAGGDCTVWQREGRSAASPASWDDIITTALAPGGLRTVFQPIVRLSDGCVVGMEALARPSGHDGRTSVEGLFAAAQRLGMMRDLDWACRRQAVESAGRLPRGFLLFLNVSAGALCDPMHPVDQMELLLAWASLRPRDVVLEITERERVSDTARLHETVARYREAGFRFAVDDLGEGHGSMATLVSVSPEFQKLAKAMLVHDDAAVAGLVAAVVGFSRQTAGSVIAEGIEDTSTIPGLVAQGIDLGQGFGICRPLEPAQAADVVRRGRIDLGVPPAGVRRRFGASQTWHGEAAAELAWPPHVARRRHTASVG